MSGRRVFIGRLSYRANNDDVKHFLRGYGRIRDIDVKRGFGFIEMEDARDAEDIVHELNGKELCGERVTVELARGSMRNGYGGANDRSNRRFSGGPSNRRDGQRENRYGPPQRTKHRIIVENLSSRVSWQSLKDLMRKAGVITFADAHRNRKNEGVVEFASHDDMKSALEKFDDYELLGRRIKLREDTSGKDFGRSRSRSGSRGNRSRSSSRIYRERNVQRGSNASGHQNSGASPRSENGKDSRDHSRQSSVDSRGSDRKN
jgi:splicing factor, arginine/serine-rich 4/5/6